MARLKKYNTRSLYFTDRLCSRMADLSDYPCTVLEAPMGYGKTTAIKETLRRLNVKVLWQNVYAQGAADFWLGFCAAFSELDAELSENLRLMGIPLDTVLRREVVRLLQSAPISTGTFLVIDDYHFVKDDRVNEFLSFLVRNLPKNLHLIILTRMPFLTDSPELRLKGFVDYIGLETLSFTAGDISKYYWQCGVATTESEQEMLYSISEGWISALYLFLLEYTVSGSFVRTRDISALVRQTVYEPLRDELKDFLNYVCLFDAFSEEQARYMWAKDNAAELLDALLTFNAFITSDRLTGEYHLHNIFNACVREEFAKLPPDEQKKLWRRAGSWNVKNAEYYKAMDYFYRAEDFDSLLFALEKDKANSFSADNKEILIRYLVECPKDVLFGHHLAMLVFSKRFFGFNKPELFEKTCAETLKNILEDSSLSEQEKADFTGEYEIIRSFACYNDISKMSLHHQKACQLMKKPSAIFDAESMWTFSSPSVLYMFYRESGMLSQHLEVMKEAMPHYYQVTSGHGMGAEYAMEAEAYYLRGDMEKAEISAHTALESAQSKNQWSITLCAEFLQVRIALYKGNYNLAATLLTNMRENLINQKHYVLLHTLDICEATIYAQIGQMQKIAIWILQGDFANTKMLFPSIPALHMVYGRVLLEQKEYYKLIGQSELFLKIAGVFPNLLCKIYIYIYLAAAYEQSYHRDEAVEQLKKALNIAVPDEVMLPFVENGRHVGILLWELGLFREYAQFLTRCRKLYEPYSVAIKTTRQKYFMELSIELTEREREVAKLAGQGLPNRQISELLFITEHTVKAHLKSVFEKLSIKSRAQIAEHLH